MNIFSAFKQYEGLPRDIYILCFQRFINSVGGFVFPFLALFLSKRLGLDKDTIGLFMLMAAVAGIPGSIISGYLVDRFNRKLILITGTTLSAIIFIICGFLGDSIAIPYLLILSSFVSSFSGPASGAMVADLTTPDNRKQSYSLLYLGMNVGLAFGFMLAGYLFENHTSWLFWGDGITTLLSLSLVVLFIKDSRPSHKEIKAINNSNRHGEKEERTNILVALGRRPFLLCFVLINSVIGFVYSQHGFIMPMHLEELFVNKGATYFGYVMTVNTIYVIIFTPIVMYLTRRFKPIINVAIATATYAIGFGVMGFASSLWVFFAAVFVWTTGEIIASVNTGVYISNHSPVNFRGRFNSIIGIIKHGGRATAPYFMGMYLVSHKMSEGWFLTGFIAVIALCLLLVLYMTEKSYKAKEKEAKSELAS